MNKTIIDKVCYFSKDVESRFLGCDQIFARCAGYMNAKRMIGLSDHDMPWGNLAESYQEDDQKVLAGEVITSIEPFVVNNVSKLVQTTKMPIYKNNKIIGLSGVIKISHNIKINSRAMKLIHELECSEPEKALLRTRFFSLTNVEQEVFLLAASGFTAKQIANKTYRSVRTIECHLSQIKYKMNSDSKLDLVMKAHQIGLNIINLDLLQ